jgi:hypothetical protein
MNLSDILCSELKRIIKSPDANDLVDISYKSFSDAACRRVEFWLKRIATYVYLYQPAVPSGHTEVPKRMISALKKYVCPSQAQAEDTYYLFKEFVIFLLNNYSPKNKRSTVITVDVVDQAVIDDNGPLQPYLGRLMAIRSLPNLSNGDACSRRK